jgi:protein-tyrosine phosphatase
MDIFASMKILMVCLGNICRSPMAEGILRDKSLKAGLSWEIDSAGTGSWHVGEPPDRRAIEICDARGIDIRDQRARQISSEDLNDYDLILTMDESNHHEVLQMARSDTQRKKISQILTYAGMGKGIIPDPYFDGRFDRVFDLLNDVCNHIIERTGTIYNVR